MKTARFAVVTLALVGLAMLAACGNKGELVRPPPPATTETPPASN